MPAIYFDGADINKIVAFYDPSGSHDGSWPGMTKTTTFTGAFTPGVAILFHKIVADVITEMTAPEKASHPLLPTDRSEPVNLYHAPVRAVTAAALETHTRSGNVLTRTGNGALPAQDGITLVLEDRLLVKDEGGGTDLENGVYMVFQVGDGANPWILHRADDAETSFQMQTCLGVLVSEGTNGGVLFVLSTVNPITLNTTALTFRMQESDHVRTVTTTPVTLSVQDKGLVVDATGGAATVNLPAAATVPFKIYRVKKKDSGGNTVTIDPNGGELIDGATTHVLTAQNQSVTFQSDGTEWWIW